MASYPTNLALAKTKTKKTSQCVKVQNKILKKIVNALIIKLENVAVDDVLPLKAARRDASANLKCFRGPGTAAI